MILETDNFKIGKYRIAQDQNSVQNLDAELTEVHDKQIAHALMGKTLGDTFISDLTTTTPQIPNSAHFTFVFNPFVFELHEKTHTCDGIKTIMTGLYYCDYVSRQNLDNTSSGNESSRTESSDPEGFIQRRTVYYNGIVRQIQLLQMYLKQNVGGNYPNYDGLQFEFESPI